MTNFLHALKADLLDRRLLPAVIALGLALAAALAYALLGAGGSTVAAPGSVTAGGPASSGVSGIVLAPPTNTTAAVAETISGSSKQRGGPSRNPFAPLPGAKPAASSKTSSSSKPASTGSGPSKPGGSAPSTGGAPATTPAPSHPAKPTTPAYDVAALFGVAPTGTPPQGPPLTAYAKLRRFTPLPSAKLPIVSFMGVGAKGKSATFMLVGEAILRGSATCVPSASSCQAINLKPGQAEQLEYLPPNGQPVTYELRVVSISPARAVGARARVARAGESVPGRELLRRAGRLKLTGLRYSPQDGTLVFTGADRPARAGGAARHRRHGS